MAVTVNANDAYLDDIVATIATTALQLHGITPAIPRCSTSPNGWPHIWAGLLGLVTSYEKRKFHLGYRGAVLHDAMPCHR